ncbi:MAG: endonuclease III [bacterium]|nr:endonuclease III [bacterium]
MKRQEKAERIQAILDLEFPEPPVPLDHDDPFTLLVAVVLSAQCTDERVNMVTPGLFEIGPDPAAMAELPVATIQDKIKTCGLAPQKAKAVSGLAKQLLAEFGSEVPRDIDALESLPGVGHKTASVVMAQAFGVPAFPVDTHIHRLAWRWGLSSGKNVTQTERDLKRTFPAERWNDLHLQIIYFGRSHCPALRHDPEACPICSWAMSQAKRTFERRAGKSIRA